MRRYRHVQNQVLIDAMKIAKAKEKVEAAIEQLRETVNTLEEIIGEVDDDDLGR